MADKEKRTYFEKIVEKLDKSKKKQIMFSDSTKPQNKSEACSRFMDLMMF